MNSEVKLSVGEWFVLFLLSIPLSVYGVVVVWALWGWFAVPLGLPYLTYAHTMGLCILITICTFSPKPNTKTFDERLGDVFGKLVMLGFAHLMGWIFYGLM